VTYQRKAVVAMSVVLTCLTVLPAFLPASGIEQVINRGELRVLMAEGDWWPFFYTDQEGELAGVDIELAKEISRTLGVRPVFIREESFLRLAESLRDGRGDVIISYYSYTPKRSSLVYLTEPYVVESDGLVVRHQVVEQAHRQYGDLTPQHLIDVLDVPERTIGTIAGTAYVEWSRELFSQAEIVVYEQEDIFQVLQGREVDALYLPEHWSQFFLAVHPQFYMNYQFFPLMKIDRITIGVAHDRLDLYLWLEKFVTYTFDIQGVLDQMYAEVTADLEPLLPIRDTRAFPVSEPYRGIVLGLIFLAGIMVIRSQQKKIQVSLAGRKPPHWLLNTWTVIFAMVTGLATGIFFPEVTEWFSPVGDLFFNYLLLAGIPILFCVVLLNFIKLMSCMGGLHFLSTFITVLFVFYIIGSLLGTITGIIGQPGSGLTLEDQQRLAEAMQRQSGNVIETTLDTSPRAMLWLLSETVVPDSVLRAFTENKTLAILFFALLSAFALHYQRIDRKRKVLELVDVANEVFMFLFKLSYYALPAGLFALMLGQAQIFVENSGLFSAFLQLTVLQFVLVLIWFGVSLGIGCWKTGLKPVRYLAMIKKPLVIAFSLLSGLAALPAAIEVTEKRPEYRDPNVKGAFPLVYLMLHPAIASMFALVTIFLAQLTGIEMSFSSYTFIVLAAVAGALATSGIPAPVYLFAISIVVLPFGIPVSQAVFFMLPWTLIGSRMEIINYILLNFGVSLFFKQEEPVSYPVGEILHPQYHYEI